MTQTIDLDALDLKANPGAFSTYDMEILVPEVEKLQSGDTYLEVGVDKGKSLSVARMVAKHGVTVCGVDLRPNPEIKDTIHFQGDSAEIAGMWQGGKIDVLFIDGDHSYEGCKADIDAWYPYMRKGGVMLFHDADETSPGVVQAVEEFAKNNKLEVYYSPNQRCSMARIYLP